MTSTRASARFSWTRTRIRAGSPHRSPTSARRKSRDTSRASASASSRSPDERNQPMSKIAFIGLGNMGGPMSENLLKAGHEVAGFDLVPAALEAFTKAGGKVAKSAAAAAAEAETVITMLPAGAHVRAVYAGEGGVLAHARKDALLIDSSTIDVETARFVAKAAAGQGFEMVDAPVSGGGRGAAGGPSRGRGHAPGRRGGSALPVPRGRRTRRQGFLRDVPLPQSGALIPGLIFDTEKRTDRVPDEAAG